MKAIDFVNGLMEIPTSDSVQALRGRQVSEGFIKEYLSSYVFKQSSSVEYHNELKNLVFNYQGLDVKIGMITFDIEPEEGDDYFVFARFEVDHLAENKNLKTIEMLEHGTDGHVLYECAQNGSSFLEAILMAARFMEKKSLDEVLYENQELCAQIAEECGDIAGGPKFYEFYKMMLGCG